jgi:hypothetical protein
MRGKWILLIGTAAACASAAADIGAVAGFQTAYTVLNAKPGKAVSTPCEWAAFSASGEKASEVTRWTCKKPLETKARECMEEAVSELDAALRSPLTAEISQALRQCRWREVDRKDGYRIHVEFKDMRLAPERTPAGYRYTTKSVSFNPHVLNSLDLMASITPQGCQVLKADEIIRHLQDNFRKSLRGYLEPQPNDCGSAQNSTATGGRYPSSNR